MPKKLKCPLVPPGIVYYAEKEGIPFWFSSLGQMIQIGTINFRRTLTELFWSVRVGFKNKSHYHSRVHFMKRRLRILMVAE